VQIYKKNRKEVLQEDIIDAHFYPMTHDFVRLTFFTVPSPSLVHGVEVESGDGIAACYCSLEHLAGIHES